jgi:hypothetical protein
MGIGAAAGAAGTVWTQQQVRRRLDALGPDHLVVTAGNHARKVGRSVADAVTEGRTAMRDREDELKARRDGVTPTRTTHRSPSSTPPASRSSTRRPPTRPATW